jgi:hypothetical protein
VTIEEWTAVIQAVVAVATLLLSGIAIYLAIQALRFSSSSLQQVSRQIDLAEAESFGSFPNVVQILGYSSGADDGLLVVVSDLAPQSRLSVIRNIELVRHDGTAWAAPRYPWRVVDISDDEYRPNRPFESERIPLLVDNSGIGVFFPVPTSLADELTPGGWPPTIGTTTNLPDDVAVRISWEDARGSHRLVAPRRAFKYNPSG